MRIGWAAVLLSGCTALFDLQSAPNADRDNDGVVDREDNCPEAFNRDQSDKDGDGVGDACDECLVGADGGDIDGDGLPDDCDECDNRDADDDGDGIPNNCDSCVNENVDVDGDGIDDGCDSCIEEGLDSDHDGIDDGCDPCHNSGVDNDNDGIDDACDTCQGPQHDEDGDGFLDSCRRGGVSNDSDKGTFDNCPAVPNPDQLDNEDMSLNGDGVGNACDGDLMVDIQYWDGFPEQNPMWDVTGPGWTIINDAARLTAGLGSFRSLGAVTGHMRINTDVFIAGAAGGALVNGAEVFVVAGASHPPGTESAICRLSATGVLSVVVFTNDAEQVDTANLILPGFPGNAATVTLDVNNGTKAVVCSAGNGLFSTQVTSGARLAAADFVAGIGGRRIVAEFRYYSAISTY